jgi:hypothetical protein
MKNENPEKRRSSKSPAWLKVLSPTLRRGTPTLKRRDPPNSGSLEIKNLLQMIPRPKEASFSEVNTFIETRGLYKKRIGWLDSALLASALLTKCRILTEDLALRRVAEFVLE